MYFVEVLTDEREWVYIPYVTKYSGREYIVIGTHNQSLARQYPTANEEQLPDRIRSRPHRWVEIRGSAFR